jgi:DNA-binding SARP family transcriptional activator
VSGGYLLAVGPGELDADVFRARVEEGRTALEAGEASGAAEALRSGLPLWRGPALAEVAYEAFAQGEIRRLEELRVMALEARIDADLQLGRHAVLTGALACRSSRASKERCLEPPSSRGRPSR